MEIGSLLKEVKIPMEKSTTKSTNISNISIKNQKRFFKFQNKHT